MHKAYSDLRIVKELYMAGIRERLARLCEARANTRQNLRTKYKDPKKDALGVASGLLSSELRFFAVADFVLLDDVKKFREQMSEAATIQQDMFDRFDRGESIDESFVTPLEYTSVFDALAAGDFSTADKLASRILEMPVARGIHVFHDKFGRALSALCVSQADAAHRIANLTKVFTSYEENLTGYSLGFLAVLNRDLDAANQALKIIVDGHRKESIDDGLFDDTEDEVLCVWGLGFANMARHLGVLVSSPDEELIPSRLLV